MNKKNKESTKDANFMSSEVQGMQEYLTDLDSYGALIPELKKLDAEIIDLYLQISDKMMKFNNRLELKMELEDLNHEIETKNKQLREKILKAKRSC